MLSLYPVCLCRIVSASCSWLAPSSLPSIPPFFPALSPWSLFPAPPRPLHTPVWDSKPAQPNNKAKTTGSGPGAPLLPTPRDCPRPDRYRSHGSQQTRLGMAGPPIPAPFGTTLAGHEHPQRHMTSCMPWDQSGPCLRGSRYGAQPGPQTCQPQPGKGVPGVYVRSSDGPWRGNIIGDASALSSGVASSPGQMPSIGVVWFHRFYVSIGECHECSLPVYWSNWSIFHFDPRQGLFRGWMELSLTDTERGTVNAQEGLERRKAVLSMHLEPFLMASSTMV